jgi:hypothetical protein
MTTGRVIMIRPASFRKNPETSADNVFQQEGEGLNINALAQQEFDGMVRTLADHSIEVAVFQDTDEPETPDALFPNNWFSTHTDGTLVMYPMMAANRRAERRADVLQYLMENFQVKSFIDFSPLEEDGEFLEGTGSLVLDHRNKLAYMARSERSHEHALEKFCEALGFQPVVFTAIYGGKPIYHTNVVMGVGEKIAVVCLDVIPDQLERKQVLDSLTNSGHNIAEISESQLAQFAGNCIELKGANKQGYLVLSQTAYDSLAEQQLQKIQSYLTTLPVAIPTIERFGGGSVRCMIAENFFEKNKN